MSDNTEARVAALEGRMSGGCAVAVLAGFVLLLFSPLVDKVADLDRRVKSLEADRAALAGAPPAPK